MSNECKFESTNRLINAWQYKDPRLKGCPEIANMINDIFDCSWSPFLFDRLEKAWFCKPLELAEAMKQAARNIELLTEVEKLADGEDFNQGS